MAKKPSSEEETLMQENDRLRTEHEKIQEQKMKDNYPPKDKDNDKKR